MPVAKGIESKQSVERVQTTKYPSALMNSGQNIYLQKQASSTRNK